MSQANRLLLVNSAVTLLISVCRANESPELVLWYGGAAPVQLAQYEQELSKLNVHQFTQLVAQAKFTDLVSPELAAWLERMAVLTSGLAYQSKEQGDLIAAHKLTLER